MRFLIWPYWQYFPVSQARYWGRERDKKNSAVLQRVSTQYMKNFLIAEWIAKNISIERENPMTMINKSQIKLSWKNKEKLSVTHFCLHFSFWFLICVFLNLQRLWCWEGLGAVGEGDDRGWDGWMASWTRWTWIWVNSGDGDEQGGLACCDSWGRKESDTTERPNWTETETWEPLLFFFLWYFSSCYLFWNSHVALAHDSNVRLES